MSLEASRKRESLPTRQSLREVVRELQGNRPQTPEEIVLNKIADRVCQSADEADAMRIELYLLDVIKAVRSGFEKSAEELVAEIKKGTGYGTLNTVVHIPDETTIHFLNEVREGLQELEPHI